MTSDLNVGILFADIVGSTRLYELLGDARALAIVETTLATAAGCVAAHGGRVVKTIGDELMAVFDSAEAAFLASMKVRRDVAAMPPLPGVEAKFRVRLRVGLTWGPAVHRDGDYFGDSVNTAARVVALASPGQILTTGDLLDSLPLHLRSLATEFAAIEVKGRHDPVRIARVADDASAPENTLIRVGAAAPATPPAALTLMLSYLGRAWDVTAGAGRIVIGREDGCDVILTGALASRQHATIEFRRDKVVLTDHSSNGTYLLIGEDRPVRLMREEFGLYRSGRIIFGRLDAPDADTLDFSLT